jgi:cytoskeletal protein RodZ
MDFTKLIPWFQQYPVWLQSLVAIWILFGGVLLVILLVTPVTSPPSRPGQSTSAESNREPDTSTPSSVEQTTSGNNSPAVAVGKGDATITIDQGREQK